MNTYPMNTWTENRLAALDASAAEELNLEARQVKPGGAFRRRRATRYAEALARDYAAFRGEIVVTIIDDENS